MNPLLAEKIKTDVIEAAKKKETKKVDALRFLLSLLQNEEIKTGKSLDEPSVMAVLQKEMKNKQEALAIFRQNSRDDLAREQEEEIEILSGYLPQMMSEKEIEIVVQEAMKGEVLDFGRLMARIMPMVKGKADGQLVVSVVKRILENRN